MATSNVAPAPTSVLLINTSINPGSLQLPLTTAIPWRILTIKDAYGTFATNPLTILTSNTDVFEDGTTSKTFRDNFTNIMLYANTSNNRWQTLTTTQPYSLTVSSLTVSTIRGDGSLLSNTSVGVSSLSSIVSYGLSSLYTGSINPGVSSLSTVVSYGLSALYTGSINPGVSSLSSVVSYGLSALYVGSINPGVSSLSTLVSYGLSSVVGVNTQGASSLSSLTSYGLSSLFNNISTFSTSIAYSFTTSSLTASTFTATTATISSLTVNGLIFGTADGYVDFDAVRTVVISSVQENTNSLYAANVYVGNTSTVNAAFFAGLTNDYSRTVIGEISTATAGVQELLLYKGGGSTDRIRLQTTGEFRLEAGVATRTWPTMAAIAAPTLYASITGTVGINTASPGATLDVVGTAGPGTLRANIVSSQQVYTSSIQANYFVGDGSQLTNTSVGLSSLSSLLSYTFSSLSTSYATSFTTSSLTTSSISFAPSTVGFVTVPILQAIGLSSIITNTGILNATTATLTNTTATSISTAFLAANSSIYTPTLLVSSLTALNTTTSSITTSSITFGAFVSTLSSGLTVTTTTTGFVTVPALQAIAISSLQGNVGTLNTTSFTTSTLTVATLGYFSTVSSTVVSAAQMTTSSLAATANVATSTLNVSYLGYFSTVSTGILNAAQTATSSLTVGAGVGWVTVGALQAQALSSIVANIGTLNVTNATIVGTLTGCNVTASNITTSNLTASNVVATSLSSFQTFTSSIVSNNISTLRINTGTLNAVSFYYNTIVSTVTTGNTMSLTNANAGAYVFVTSVTGTGSNVYVSFPTVSVVSGSFFVVNHTGGDTANNNLVLNNTSYNVPVSTSRHSVYTGTQWVGIF